jgi:hypothetical protein
VSQAELPMPDESRKFEIWGERCANCGMRPNLTKLVTDTPKPLYPSVKWRVNCNRPCQASQVFEHFNRDKAIQLWNLAQILARR